MSSEFMRQILESIENTQHLTEGYEDRIQQVVAWFANEYPQGVTRKEYPQAIKRAGYVTGVSELRGQASAGLNQKIGNSRNEFIKDVAAELTFKRDTSKTDDKRQRSNRALEQIADIIQTAVGNAWPDGDPWDQMYPKLRKLGVRDMDMIEWLDRATRKHLSPYKDYHDYVASTWDDFKDQTQGIQDLGDRPNPWS